MRSQVFGSSILCLLMVCGTPAGYSGASQPPIPDERDQAFRANLTGDSGLNVTDSGWSGIAGHDGVN